VPLSMDGGANILCGLISFVERKMELIIWEIKEVAYVISGGDETHNISTVTIVISNSPIFPICTGVTNACVGSIYCLGRRDC